LAASPAEMFQTPVVSARFILHLDLDLIDPNGE
jgi:hypothetical protein